MKRREFIATSAILSLGTNLNSQELTTTNINSWIILDEVLEILFPKTETMPSAKEFNAIAYLKEVSSHNSFDEYDKELLFQGAMDFFDAFPKFLEVKSKEKMNFIKRANQSSYGQEWLDRVIYYGIEAMLSDPIYGGNKNEIGWKSLNHQTGQPRPRKKYARVV